MAAANPTSSGVTASCIYLGEDETPVVSTVLQSGLAAINTYLDDPANESVPGIGDRAVIFQATDLGLPTGRTIYFSKGDLGFVLNVHLEDVDDATAKTMLTDLATIAAGRI